jgi:hypothetical protein
LVGERISDSLYTKLRVARKLKDKGIDTDVLKGAPVTRHTHRSVAVSDETIDSALDYIMEQCQGTAHGDKAVYLESTGETVRIAPMMRTESISAMEQGWTAIRKIAKLPGLHHDDFRDLCMIACPTIIKSMAALDPVREKFGRENFAGMTTALTEVAELVVHSPELIKKIDDLISSIAKAEIFMKDKQGGFQAHFASSSGCCSHSPSHAFGTKTAEGPDEEVSKSCNECEQMSEVHTAVLNILAAAQISVTGEDLAVVGMVKELGIVLNRGLERMWAYVDHMARIAWESDVQVSTGQDVFVLSKSSDDGVVMREKSTPPKDPLFSILLFSFVFGDGRVTRPSIANWRVP